VGGRKPVEETVPAGLVHLERLIDPATRGDPMSPLRWTSKSTRHLAEALSRSGYPISHETVAQLLRVSGYSLQGTAKTLEGTQHPDRNAQFRVHQSAHQAILSAALAGDLGGYQRLRRGPQDAPAIALKGR
jgi:hypothetical protein